MGQIGTYIAFFEPANATQSWDLEKKCRFV